MRFHNPYNFIPALPRGEGGDLMPEGLRDGAPAGHHRWHDELYSGQIAITIEVCTPLLLMTPVDPPKGAKATPPEGHRHLDVATYRDGDVDRVDLAPTQIKGLLRSAFEAVTNSRLGVFDQERKLGYRVFAERGPDRLPALIRIEDGEARLQVLSDKVHPVVAKLQVWKESRKQVQPRPELLDREFLREGAPVLAVVSGGKQSWQVDEWYGSDTPLDDIPVGSRQRLVRGWPHITGRTCGEKGAEYLFVTEVWERGAWQNAAERALTVEKQTELIDGYRALIAEQRGAHRFDKRNEVLDRDAKAAPWDYLGDEPGRTAWSRHLYDLADLADRPWDQPPWLRTDLTVPEPDAEPGPLQVITCWAELDKGKVARLTPVAISRALHKAPPRDLLDPSLRPAERIEQLSPADRVFGWVRSSRSDDEDRATHGHRGQVRVVDVVCPTRKKAVHNLSAGGVTIAPLSAPKPSQGLFYVGDLVEGKVKPLKKVSEKLDFFDADAVSRTLRGRKVYPHHQGLVLDESGNPKPYDLEKSKRVFRYQPSEGQEKTSQNATLHGWVKPGATFQAVIQVDSLHRMELGALLWLLDPDRLGQGGVPGVHRLGMGKPLGFGSVEVRIDKAATRLSTGGQIAERFLSLADAPETSAWEHLAEEFEQAMTDGFAPVLSAMRNAAVGFPPDDRVHYPRSLDGEHGYEWFVANDNALREKRKPQALPALDQGLDPLKGYPKPAKN